jgi:asparagine synthase (glutamine-hydrolysing)
MSGICGQFNLDDAPVAATDLQAMTSMLERRGPQGTNRWQDGSVGLGHALLATTPELQLERQPVTHQETGCVITADVRLDNRDELLDALALSQQQEALGDGGLILAAYLNWGDACLDHLLGDFAFAIWDPRHRKLLCARDHFGLRPLYYHHVPGQRFLLASDARAILVLPQVPYRINQARIADYLVPELEWIDYTSTFFEGVYRLPPGHKAVVTPGRLDIAEYWPPRPGPELAPMSDDDYQQGFLEVFTKAVDARLRAPANSVGSMLSGGMDSGAVTAVARDLVVARGNASFPTYSCARSRENDCAESRAIYAAAAMPSIAPHIIRPEALGARLEALVSGNEEPFDGECLLLKSVYLEAQAQGQNVVLDGAGGDIALNEGTYVARLLRQGQLRLAIAEIAAENRLWGETTLASDLLRNARTAYVPEPVRTLLRRLRHPLRVRKSLNESLISREFAGNSPTALRSGNASNDSGRCFPGSGRRIMRLRHAMRSGRTWLAGANATHALQQVRRPKPAIRLWTNESWSTARDCRATCA